VVADSGRAEQVAAAALGVSVLGEVGVADGSETDGNKPPGLGVENGDLPFLFFVGGGENLSFHDLSQAG